MVGPVIDSAKGRDSVGRATAEAGDETTKPMAEALAPSPTRARTTFVRREAVCVVTLCISVSLR